MLIGTPGQQVRYVYTGRRSERSPYIAERAQSMHGLRLTRGQMLRMFVCLFVWFYGLRWSVVDFALLRMEPTLPRQVITRYASTPRLHTVEV